MSEFRIQSGKLAGKKLRLMQSEVVIGRDESCQIRLVAQEISRFHCVLKQTPSGIIVKDLGSSNGTHIDDVMIEGEHLLKVGEVLRIGPMTLVFDGDPEEARRISLPKPAKSVFDDDEIADWLKESETAAGGDTTIIRSMNSQPVASRTGEDTELLQTPALPQETETIPSVQHSFDTVADEAADIIRRHWDMLKQENAQPH